MVRQHGKIYAAVIKREAPCLSDNVPKKLRKTKEAGVDFLGRIFFANSCQFRLEPQPKIMKALVSHCKAVCAPPTDLVISVTSEKLKRDVGAFVSRCRWEQ